MIVVNCPNCGARNRVDETRFTVAVCGRCRAALRVPTIPSKLTDATFDSFLRAAGSKPIIVDCWAPWCGPCRMIAPIIDQLAAESGGRYLVAKLNTDENPDTAGQFNISSIPTLLIFRNRTLIDRLVGVQPKAIIAKRLQSHL